jgi:alpha-L-fucosidase 2
VLDPEKDRDLLKRSVDHWLAVTMDSARKGDQAIAVCGYTCSGAASMYALLHDGDRSLSYLNMMPFHNVSSTTMYAEGNPVIETPFSAATSIHDMLIQSWDGRIRVFPAVPSSWPDVQFRRLLAQGGVEVTADRRKGRTQLLLIESRKRQRTVEFTADMDAPSFSLLSSDGKLKSVELKRQPNGFYSILLSPDRSLLAASPGVPPQDCQPVKPSGGNSNIFGFNPKYERALQKRRMP